MFNESSELLVPRKKLRLKKNDFSQILGYSSMESHSALTVLINFFTPYILQENYYKRTCG